MAQTVERKLTENEESNDNQEQVLDTMYTNIQKIIQEKGLSRDATMRTNKELVSMDQKLKGWEKT